MAKKLIVAAIDFGTTFSGYAWSLESNYKRDPLKIQIPVWQGSSCLTYKTPTCILFEPDGKFHSFGYKAQDDFFSMTENNEHHEWYYFRQFKMKLYHEEKITKDAEIKDEQGNAMKALDVFAAAINYLQRHFNNEIQKQLKGIEPDDIQWVLTVPAIWNDTAKSFMREAAVKAGIQEDQLILALEPEVAAIYCVSQCKDQPDIFSHGSQYLLLDAGVQPKTGTKKSTLAAEVDIPSNDLHATASDKNRNLESKSSIQPKTGTKKSTLASEVDIPSNDLHATASDKNRNLESKSSVQPKTGTKKSTVAAEVDIPSSDLHVTASDKNINLESKTSIQPKTRTEKSTSVAPEVDIPSSDLHVTASDKNINLESKSSILPKTGTEKSTFVAAEVDIPSSDLHATYSQ